MSKLDLDSLQPKIIPGTMKAPEGMTKFTISRINDQSGVSGIGVVAQGVIFAAGQVAIQWLTPYPDGDVQIKSSLEKWIEIHATPHPSNITVITFETGEISIHPTFVTVEDLKKRTVSELNEYVKQHLQVDEPNN